MGNRKVKEMQSCSKWTRRSWTPPWAAKIKSVTAITAGKGGGQVVQKDSKFLVIFFHCWELSMTSRELGQLRSTGCQEWHQNDQVKWAVWLGIETHAFLTLMDNSLEEWAFCHGDSPASSWMLFPKYSEIFILLSAASSLCCLGNINELM